MVPTYPVGPPEAAPLFYEGRTYQGAKGPAYPYPIVDKLLDSRKDQAYQAIYLENEFLKICVLPELGGRIFEAVDKTNSYHFFYRNHVIKPALIGMLGAWISGGVEWNIPHHHRASSFMQVPYQIEEGPDGSKTVWVGEMELRHRMRWLVGLTLHPGKAYVEATVRLLNRTPLANSLLYFANVAVHANENYQIIFPPSTRVAAQHSKVEFSEWPVSHQQYAGVDFSKGVDVSWYKNHPSHASMFAFECEEDFLAGYDHGKRAGTLHIAEHGIMPGKKFFTWGNGGDGRAWDRILTDTDGPYLELMVGGYSDNQPDYSWVQPYEVKTIKEFWYPFRDIGGVKNANLEAAVNLEIDGRTVKAGFYTTEVRAAARVLLQGQGKPIFGQTVGIAPGKPFLFETTLPEGIRPEQVRASLSVDGKELIAYQPAALSEAGPLPRPVEKPSAPAEMKTNEELYLAGLRLEQFHSPAREPDPYYLEALKRDPADYRANTALGLLLLRRGEFAGAERHFRAAVARVTKNYTKPRDGEAHYYLGSALTYQGKDREAQDAFYQASWNYGWAAASYYALAELACREKDFQKALTFIDRSLSTNAINTKGLNLKAVILRHLGRTPERAQLLAKVLELDPLDPWAKRERALDGQAPKEPIHVLVHSNDDLQPYLEMAVDYARSGLWDDGIAVLGDVVATYQDKSRVFPMVYYYLGYLNEAAGREDRAAEYYQLAAKMPQDYCFPFRMESIQVLRQALQKNPQDAAALYYLGNLLYDVQPEAATQSWEAALRKEPALAMAQRNLALAYAHRQHDYAKAIPTMEAAFRTKKLPRFLLELDQLYEDGGVPLEKRLALFEENQTLAADRDDTFSREISLRVQKGQYDKALGMLKGRVFHVWEGARTSTHEIFVDAQLLRGHEEMKAGRYAEALKHYQAAMEYPENLGVGKPYRGDRSQVAYYYVAIAQSSLGQRAQAAESLKKCVNEPDGKWMSAEMRYHIGLALSKLGEKDKAARQFEKLRQSGREALERGTPGDDFAKFGGGGSGVAEKAQAHFMLGLGHLGAGEETLAKKEFDQTLQLKPSDLWASYYRRCAEEVQQ